MLTSHFITAVAVLYGSYICYKAANHSTVVAVTLVLCGGHSCKRKDLNDLANALRAAFSEYEGGAR